MTYIRDQKPDWTSSITLYMDEIRFIVPILLMLHLLTGTRKRNSMLWVIFKRHVHTDFSPVILLHLNLSTQTSSPNMKVETFLIIICV